MRTREDEGCGGGGGGNDEVEEDEIEEDEVEEDEPGIQLLGSLKDVKGAGFARLTERARSIPVCTKNGYNGMSHAQFDVQLSAGCEWKWTIQLRRGKEA